MIETYSKAPLGGLARKLVQLNLLSEAAAFQIAEQALKQNLPFISCLIENKAIDPTLLASTCAQEFGLPLLDLDAYDAQYIPMDLLDPELVINLHALPLFKRGHRLFIGISDATNLKAIDEIKYKVNIPTDPILVEEHKLSRLIEKTLAIHEAATLGNFDDANLDNLDILIEEDSKAVTEKEAEDAPIVRYINKIILEAINLGASDIHLEPYEKTFRIRFRRDGVLYENSTPPINISNRFAARIKILARLDISERRLPQDGRFKMRISNNRSIDFRVSSCPTLFGEKIVIRILDPSSAKLSIEALGLEDFQKALILEAIHKPQGMILVTGPTGSGKTVSLYTALSLLNTPEVNISTCEDPVEINLPGINQVNVNLKAGLTFSNALRAFLRQDPDIIMIGEIRDLETAEIAIKAAQTGHLVLSTLHTNSAPETLSRLINMGLPAYNLASSIHLIMAQRLARLLCTYCKVPLNIPEPALLQMGFTPEEVPGLKLFGPKGCEHCKEGYKGRLGIYEVMPISPAISDIMMQGGHSTDIAKQAALENVWSLRRSGLEKVKAGLTSLEEISRITKD